MIRLTDDTGSLEFAEQLWERFCEDLTRDPNMAKVRLISGVQIAIRDARNAGETPAIFYVPDNHSD